MQENSQQIKILSIDVGANTGIATYDGISNYDTLKFKHEKSLTLKDLIKDQEWIKEYDILLLEWQNDTWSKVNTLTQKSLQDKNNMWKAAFMVLNPNGEVIEIRKSTITPLLKQLVSFKANKRENLKKASIEAFNRVFGEYRTDDETDAYWFIKSFQKNYLYRKENNIIIWKNKEK